MTSLPVILVWAPPIKNPGYAYAWEEGAFWAVHPQITACTPQSRVNFCTSTRGQANFCPKTDYHKRFFLMKQQDRSSERDQDLGFVMKTFFYFVGLHLQI